MIPKESIDLGKSIFLIQKRSEFNFKSYDEFIKTDYSIIPKKYTQMYFMMSMLSVFRAKGYFF